VTVISVDKTLSVLEGRHELTLLTLTREHESFAVEYTITPPLPGDRPGGEMVFMWIEAVDDHGHAYTDFGGARGASDDGTRTVGTISGRPGIPSDAHEVSLRFVFLHGQSETGYDVTIGLR
jgi:hypothetical protein